MEKICIATRRRRELFPVSEEAGGHGTTDFSGPMPVHSETEYSGSSETASSTISMELTPDQSRALHGGTWFDPGKAFVVNLEQSSRKDGQVVLSFRLTPLYGGRMLSPGDVSTMLRISKSLLAKLVRTRRIESYRIGRLRRFLLEDVLRYLSRSREFSEVAVSSGAAPAETPDKQGE